MQNLDKQVAIDTAIDLIGALSFVNDERFKDIIVEAIRNDDESLLTQLSES